MPEDSSMEPEAATTADGRRNRGRPATTVHRDAAVLERLRTSPHTKVGLAESLGIAETDVYLSLRRLRNAGLVTRMRGNTSHTWIAVANTAAPESATATGTGTAVETAAGISAPDPQAPEPASSVPAIAFSAPEPDPLPDLEPESAPEPLPAPAVVFQPEPQGPAQPEVWF